jgi:hypothetical protein
MTIDIAFTTVPAGISTGGTSESARFVYQESKKVRDQLLKSFSFGARPNSIQNELQEVMEQCSSANWDGYMAEPVKREALFDAFRFAQVIPLGLSAPAVGVEPDGDVTFEWHAGPRRTLSVSVDEKGNLHYSALLGPNRSYGTEAFVGFIPKRILDLIYQVATG